MTSQDPSAALTSLLALLAQTNPQPPPSTPPVPQPPAVPSANGFLPLEDIEPVFAEGDILDTTPWIGAARTSWRSPLPWTLPQEHQQRQQRRPPPAHEGGQLQEPATSQGDSVVKTGNPNTPHDTRSISPSLKRKRSSSPPATAVADTSPANPPPAAPKSYSHAVKHVFLKMQDAAFLTRLQAMRTRQMDLERDLFEERERIVRRGETKRIMQEVLRRVVVGSTGKGDEVWYPCWSLVFEVFF